VAQERTSREAIGPRGDGWREKRKTAVIVIGSGLRAGGLPSYKKGDAKSGSSRNGAPAPPPQQFTPSTRV
jgi:hypothetical protein